ncbi:MAG TPA: GNAT family N-acetyltransferase [Pyrinomonadaceae bacterium]
MKLVFTPASDSDADELVELMREFYAFEHIAFDEGAARRALRQILRDGVLGVIYLIRAAAHEAQEQAQVVEQAHEEQVEVAGYLVITFGFSLEFHGRDAFVDELFLRERFRGRGIGRACVEFAAEVCRAKGIAALHLEVERANTRAQALYRRSGFRDHDRYLLTKWL